LNYLLDNFFNFVVIQIENKNYLEEHKNKKEFHFAYDHMNGTGELYMRMGVALFSVATMIDRCLTLIQIFEVYTNNQHSIQDCYISFICSMISNTLSLIFIFLQSFFIFKYANIVINYGKNVSVIGLMHLLSTNFCVCLRTIIHETITEIRHHSNTVYLIVNFVTKML
jgi:hypothetical protein